MRAAMSMPMPPQLEQAFTQVNAALQSLEGPSLDLAKSPWDVIEKGVIKLLGGPFKLEQPEHQVVALAISVGLAARLNADHQAFWFPYRETPEGASLGFPESLIMLSPFGAVVDALRSARLAKLEDISKEIRNTLAQVKFSGASGAMRLGPEDYMRLFDPAFVQLVALDGAKALQTWNLGPERVAIDLRDAIGRSKLSPDAKKQLEQQLVGTLNRLEVGKPLLKQVARGARLVETMGLLFATNSSSGAAAEEFWTDVVMPLLFVGAPTTFPPLEEEELAAAKQGVDPLFLFLEVVPYQHKAPEDGLLGAFAGANLSLPAPEFQAVQQVRLIKVGLEELKAPLAAFDADKTRAAVKRFGELLHEKTGPVPTVQGAEEAKMMFDAAMTLIGELKTIVASGKDVYVRRLTEAEASSEPAFTAVRAALSAPRIILAP
jgi:hypothetical protein